MGRKKSVQFLNVIFVALFCVSLASCEKDESENDPQGTITVKIRNKDNGYTKIDMLESNDPGYFFLTINKANNFSCFYQDFEMVDVGAVSGLSAINSIPQQGWSTKVAVLPGHGYIARIYGYKTDRLYYVRFYAISYIKGTSGGIIGANVKYQSPWQIF